MAREKVYLFDHSPHLRGEWDYEKNTLNPDILTHGSNKGVWWKCSSGHSSFITPNSKTKGFGCVYCSGQRPVVGVNDLGTTSPVLASELFDERFTPSDFTLGSHHRVQWRCHLGHTFHARVSDRSNRNNGCPACSNRICLTGFNDIATTHPELAAELHDPIFDSSNIQAGSNKKVTWRCSKGHEWSTSPNHRTSKGSVTGCPYCAGNRVIPGENDIGTTNPTLAAELNDDRYAAEDLKAMSGYNVQWLCPNGHAFKATVANRSKGSDCPKCSLKRTSKIEVRLKRLLEASMEIPTESGPFELEFTWGTRRKTKMRVDILGLAGSGKLLAVEYDGAYFHQSRQSMERDTLKTNALLEHGYRVVRIREVSGPLALPLLDIHHENLLQIPVTYSLEDDNLLSAVDTITQWLVGPDKELN